MRRIWDFEAGRNSWAFEDDLFRFTEAPRYARGWHHDSDARGGMLALRLGGRDGRDVDGMSGGFTRAVDLDTAGSATLTLRFKLEQSPHYERGEHSDLLVSLDGALVGRNGESFVARLRGDGDGGGAKSTGWKTVTLDLGRIEAGRHEIAVGGFSSGKDARNERTTLLIDKVVLRVDPPDPAAGLARFEARGLELTNAFRAKHGLDPLAADASLTAAAEDWSRTMARSDSFEHSDLLRQAESIGYAPRALGENIAAGQATPGEVVRGWIDSPGHRANLLGDFEEIGIGYFRMSDDRGEFNATHYWTQIFGTDAL